MFSSLSIATSGIRAAQLNLAVTGHNVSNAEIPGYSRQRVVQTTAFVRQVGTNRVGNPIVHGMGTDWQAVQQIRNEFLDISYRENVGRLSFYAKMVETGFVVESLLGELQGSYNFQTVLNEMWFAIQELTSDPGGLQTRQLLIATATSFLRKAQDVFNGLVEYQHNLDLQVRQAVGEINHLVSQINSLNERIYAAEAMGDNANDFRDERHRYIDRLAELVPLDVSTAPNGHIQLSSQGHQLLAAGNQNFLGLRFISDEHSFVEPVFTTSRTILSAGTPPSEFRSFTHYTRPINSANNNDFGALNALLVARGTSPATAQSEFRLPSFYGNHIYNTYYQPLADARDALALANQDLANARADLREANAELQRLLDYHYPDATHPDIIAAEAYRDNIRDNIIPPLETAQTTASTNFTTASTIWNNLTNTLEQASEADLRARFNTHLADLRIAQAVAQAAFDANPSEPNRLALAHARRAVRDAEADIHNWNALQWSLQHAFIPNVQKNLDRIFSGVVTLLNDAFTGNLRDAEGNVKFPDTPPMDALGRPGIPMFVRVTDGPNPSWPFDSPSQNPNRAHTLFTISNVKINDLMLDPDGHNRIALSMTGIPGVIGAPDDTDLLNAIQDVWQSYEGPYAVRIGDRTHRIQDAYGYFVGGIATAINEARGALETSRIQTIQADNMRQAIKGVAMDEELNFMLRFQFAFQASARALNVIDSMIDQVVNRTGRAGL